jgi:dTDP-L-rhamnose 4-epimerase
VKVLLTGGAGFIGSVVNGLLQATGHDAVVLDRALDPRDDVTDLDRVRPLLSGCEVVVHLAAKVGLGVNIRDIDDYVRQNDLGTAVVLRAASEAGVSRIVYASSMVVYGEGAYSCAEHGPVAPPPRAAADSGTGARVRAPGPPQRVRRHQGPWRTARRNLEPGDRWERSRGPFPQRVRTRHAP